MRKLLNVALFLCCNLVHAGYVTVTGMGRSFEEAKQQGFRTAIEFVVGANVLSDVETQNYKRIKDEIYIYSSGYVDDYKINNEEIRNNIVYLTMEVLVSENKIKNRIISVGKSNTEFNGDRHSTQINTYVESRMNASRLLDKHLSQYPKRALTISQSSYTVTLDERRNPVLNIPYTIAWNYDFVKTLREILTVIQDTEDNRSSSAIVIMVKDPNVFLFGKKTVHRFTDLYAVNQLHDAVNGTNQVRIIVRLKDMYNNDVHTICYVPMFISGYSSSFYDTGEYRVKQIFGNNKEEGIIKLPINIAIVNNISKIELSLDSDFVCKK